MVAVLHGAQHLENSDPRSGDALRSLTVGNRAKLRASGGIS
jgi:hypothetical protein